jgi:hypothetical protein
MYPPLAVLVTNLYGGGRNAGTLVFGMPPDRVKYSEAGTNGNIVCNVLQPEKLQNDKSAPVKFAATRF